MLTIQTALFNMTKEEFEEWLDSFVSHFNFISSRFPHEPYKIGYHVYLTQDKLFTQHVKMYYEDSLRKDVYYVDSHTFSPGSKLGAHEDWTNLMQSLLIDIMTAGADKLVQDTKARG